MDLFNKLRDLSQSILYTLFQIIVSDYTKVCSYKKMYMVKKKAHHFSSEAGNVFIKKI